ncbi:uncharacterized protein [Halyomorpha halys]|uniref:uncharacterized protein n=1 Tax=Halyomorpha halys TaxID=286706 RepID=UPI0006D5125B|nr:serine/arginine-rich splicing factor RS2Z32-like [Halyomorpha halys]
MVDTSAREEESRMQVEDAGWSRVTYTRPRNFDTSWRRRKQREAGRDRGTADRRTNQARPRNGCRKEDRRCHGCGKTGHLVVRLPRKRCFECGEEGHIAKQCRYIYRRKEADRGEPMEMNVQRVRRRRGLPRSDESSSESSESSEAIMTDPEEQMRKRDKKQKTRWQRTGERGRLHEKI